MDPHKSYEMQCAVCTAVVWIDCTYPIHISNELNINLSVTQVWLVALLLLLLLPVFYFFFHFHSFNRSAVFFSLPDYYIAWNGMVVNRVCLWTLLIPLLFFCVCVCLFQPGCRTSYIIGYTQTTEWTVRSTSQLNLRIRRRKRLVRPWSAQCMVCMNIAKKYQNTNEQKTKKRRNKLRTRGARTQN